MWGFFKPILRNKHECLERASSSLLCSVASISHILLSLHECYQSPYSSLSDQLSFNLICFLKDKYVARCLTLSEGLTQAACSL